MNTAEQTDQKIEHLPIAELVPYARNSRTHSEEQVAQIAGSIREFGFTNPVLIDASGTIVAGHGRVMAARKLGLETVPCIRLGHLTPTQVRAYVIADNKLALNAGWDEQMLAAELAALKEDDFSLGLTGFSDEELNELLSADGLGECSGEDYTDKIDAPVYTPKGDRPPIEALLDASRAESLIREIESAKLPKDVERFLKAAASRHIVFDYEKIAEFYCHADKKTQELMENSALVIIDFKKAMQRGYAQLKVEISDAIGGVENDEETPHD